MNKGTFLKKTNVAAELSNKAFSKLGLSSKKCINAYSEEITDLKDEEHFVRKDFAKLGEDGLAKRDQHGNLVLDETKEKELFTALKAWRKEPIEFELNKFTPVEITGKLLFISPAVYDELNGFVFNVSEEDYINTIEAEILRQDQEK